MNAIRCRSKFEKETQLYLSSKDMNKERNFVLDIVTFIFHIIHYHRENTFNYSHKISKVPLLIHILLVSFISVGQKRIDASVLEGKESVSYTHLTLPTICSV